ncbi:DUF4249 family protein [Chondrinema litorale]|uniref:DUF4249 family protein n=1 Tax=Chondrinema litorale TaxID=2994555 RepID=UPI0025431B0E|nr:DUF4249 family protein [Chondrinema litorale]UZR92811.1 DUF4249 family protein [Chondrinema litorale]
MNNHTSFIRKIFSVFVIIVLTACVEQIEWEEALTHSEALVVEGFVSSELKQQLVKISNTQTVINSSDPIGVSNAVVTVSVGDSIYHYSETEAGVYLSDQEFSGNAGEVYHLEIQYKGELFEADAEMMAANEIQPVKVIQNEYRQIFYNYILPSNFGADAPLKISVHAEVAEGWQNNYPADTDFGTFWGNRIGEAYQNKDTTYYLHPTLEPAAIFAYSEHEIGAYPLGTEIIQVYRSIAPEHYQFIRAVLSETEWRGIGPFGYIPADVKGNISNGARGYFYATEVKVLKQVIDGKTE